MITFETYVSCVLLAILGAVNSESGGIFLRWQWFLAHLYLAPAVLVNTGAFIFCLFVCFHSVDVFWWSLMSDEKARSQVGR